MSGRGVSQTKAESAPLALVLVRNSVNHDARVLREAATLRGLRFTVLVCGVVSTSAPETELAIDGAQVLRLDPAGALRRLRRLGAGRAGNGASGDGAPAPDARAGAGARARLVAQIKRLAVTTAFYYQGIALARRTSPALVHANDYNTMWIGLAAKLLCGSRLIYDSHELWPDRNGRPEWRPWLIACEALFVRVADATITTSPGYAEAIAARYRVPAPIVVRNIPVRDRPAGGRLARSGIPAAADAPADRRPCRSASGGSPLAVYLGGLMPGRGLEQSIDALALVPELRLALIGPGRDSYRAALRRRIDAAGVTDRAEVRPAVPAGEVVEAIRSATLGLMLIQPVCRSYELTLPNKLFEYAAAGLPILTSDLPVIGPLVQDEGLGEVVPAEDVEQIARALRRLADPDINAERRARVSEFAERVTSEQERAILEHVYREVG